LERLSVYIEGLVMGKFCIVGGGNVW